MPVMVLHRIARFVTKEFDVTFEFDQEFSCEIKDYLCEYLVKQFPDCKAHFVNNGLLVLSHAPVFGGGERPVRFVSIFTAGFTCKAVSKLNVNSKRNVGCVQRGEGSTGQSFLDIKAWIEKWLPEALYLENLDDLLQVCPETLISDADYIVDWLHSIGYGCAFHRKVNARDYGSFPLRVRLFFLAIYGQDPGDKRRLDIDMALAAMQLESDEFEASFSAYALPELVRTCDTKEAKLPIDRPFKYKAVHSELFDDIGLEWPLRTDYFPKLQHIDQRAKEVIAICNIMFPYKPEGLNLHREWLDFNLSVQLLLGKDMKSNPWRKGAFPTMTGSGQYVMRWGSPCEQTNALNVEAAEKKSYIVEFRQVDGLELFQMAGMDMKFYRNSSCVPSHEVASEMAGNCYSAFAAGPISIALLVGLADATVSPCEDCKDDVDSPEPHAVDSD